MKNSNIFLSVFVFCSFVCWTFQSNAQYTKLIDFEGTPDGSYPYGSLISDSVFLYGMTYGGGAYNKGTIFKIKSDGTGYVKLLDFSGLANGMYPHGSLISDGTFLYGMTYVGGINDMGVIFKIMPDGTNYTKIFDFSGIDGKYTYGSFIFDGVFLYGMTQLGGQNEMGTIFKIMPNGTGYVKLLDFSGTLNGAYPTSSLFFDGTFLYGMTYSGGIYNEGVLFKIMPDGTSYNKLLDFESATNGMNPFGSLVSDGTFLYGMTFYGGTNGYGILFKIKPDGTEYAKLIDFMGINGANPHSTTLIFDGTFLYGMTGKGGTNGIGVIFKIKPNGTDFVKLFDFTGITNGSYPHNSLNFFGNSLYGMTFEGGINDFGTIFKFDLVTNITKNNSEMDFSNYPNPTKGKLTIAHTSYMKSIEVLNILGETVYQSMPNNYQTTTEIDLTNIPKGIYFVKVDNGEKVRIEKIVLN